jgi:hypothetical protein
MVTVTFSHHGAAETSVELGSAGAAGDADRLTVGSWVEVGVAAAAAKPAAEARTIAAILSTIRTPSPAAPSA